ncbi:hypothetical protein INT47_009312 [Mucor saturninus]|uniref:Aminopeptidase n=1 Tax=Mucor saturninus TaxID=64648 RepID=A0A8H7QPX9_9FUNG|nr:hypothetical protein INT47_009312 [Mucor saturninus]
MPHTCCSSKRIGAVGFHSPTATNQYAPNKVIEPIHIEINLRFKDLSSRIVTGKVTHTFKHNGTALVSNKKDLTQISLNAENFENVKVSGDEVDYRYDGHLIHLTWKEPFEKNSERKVTIEYTLDQPIAGLYFQNPDTESEGSTWAITDHEPEKARHWLPTVDYPTVRTTLSWAITAPKDLTALANGTFMGDEINGDYRTTMWELDYPCPSYLVCFAVGEFVEADDGQVDNIPIKYFADKRYKKEDLIRAFDKTPSMIKWLQEKVGVPFPWSKYYQIATQGCRGAMENISLVTWNDMFILDETHALELKHLTDLVNIHEMAHTYFGDLLVIRHFEHAWLKEGWATYIETCYLQDNVSEDAFKFEMLENQSGYTSECERYMRPIVTRKYDSSWDMFDRHTYPGGAWRLHMLRSLMGDEAFWSGVQTYIQRYAKKTVQTSEFQSCLEEASGLNLSRFFDEWLLSKGYPKLKGQYEFNDQAVKITLSQTQVDEAEQVPLFGFSVEIEVTTDADRVYQGLITFDALETVSVSIQIPEGEKPTQLRIDPEYKVLFSLEMPSVDRNILIETAKSAKDVVNRIWAYSELIKNGSRPCLKAVREAILQEPYYGVRTYTARKLANLNSLYSIEILSELLDAEKDPLAMAAIAGACAIVDDRLRDALIRFLQRDGLPYRAHAAALASLGSQRNNDDLKYLLQVANDDTKIGQHGLIRGGALKALGLHRSEEAFKHLLNAVSTNKEHIRARPFAIQGLAKSAPWQTECLKNTAIEEITKLTRDSYQFIRVNAVEALVQLKVKSSYGTIATTRSMYSKDDQSWFNRKLTQLNNISSNDDQSNANKELVEKLETRIKKLEEKLSLEGL